MGQLGHNIGSHGKDHDIRMDLLLSPDEDPVVKYEWLALLDVAQGGHVKHHPVHVVGVAAHLGGGALGFYWSLVEFNWNCA